MSAGLSIAARQRTERGPPEASRHMMVSKNKRDKESSGPRSLEDEEEEDNLMMGWVCLSATCAPSTSSLPVSTISSLLSFIKEINDSRIAMLVC